MALNVTTDLISHVLEGLNPLLVTFSLFWTLLFASSVPPASQLDTVKDLLKVRLNMAHPAS